MTDPQGTAAAALVASVVSELVGGYDVLELLDRLLLASADGAGASGAAVLVPDGAGSLQVLAATSETAQDLEIFQLMTDEGPAFDCLASGDAVLEPDMAAVQSRWPAFAPVARAAGMTSVGSVHMGVNGTSVGALNLFDPTVTTVRGLAPVQASADVAVLAILQAGPLLLAHARRTGQGLSEVAHQVVHPEVAAGVLAVDGRA